MRAERSQHGYDTADEDEEEGGRMRRPQTRSSDTQSERDRQNGGTGSDDEKSEREATTEQSSKNEGEGEPNRSALAEQLRSGGMVGAAPERGTGPGGGDQTQTHEGAAKPEQRTQDPNSAVATEAGGGKVGTKKAPQKGPDSGGHEGAAEAGDESAQVESHAGQDAKAMDGGKQGESSEADSESSGAGGEAAADAENPALAAVEGIEVVGVVAEADQGQALEVSQGERVDADAVQPEEVGALESEAPEPLAALLGRQVGMGTGALETLQTGLDGQAAASESTLLSAGRTCGGSVSAGYHHAGKAVASAASTATKGIKSSLGLARISAGTLMGVRLAKNSAAVAAAKQAATAKTQKAQKKASESAAVAGKRATKIGGDSANKVFSFIPRARQGATGKGPEKQINGKKRQQIAKKIGPGVAKNHRKAGQAAAGATAKLGKGTASQMAKAQQQAGQGMDAAEVRLQASASKVYQGAFGALMKQEKSGLQKANKTAKASSAAMGKTSRAARRALNKRVTLLVQGLQRESGVLSQELNNAKAALLASQATQLHELLHLFELAQSGGPAAAPEAGQGNVEPSDGGAAQTAQAGASSPVKAETPTAADPAAIIGQIEAVATGLLQQQVAELAQKFQAGHARLVALSDSGSKGLRQTERRQRAAARKMSQGAQGTLKALAGQAALTATRSDKAMTGGMGLIGKAADEAIAGSLKQLSAGHTAADKAMQPKFASLLGKLAPDLSKGRETLKKEVTSQADAATAKLVTKVVGKVGKLASACRTDKEAGAARAVRGITKDEAKVLRYRYRTETGRNAVSHIKELDSGSERSEALAWVLGRRGRAARIVMARTIEDKAAMPDLEAALRSLDAEGRKELTGAPGYAELRKGLVKTNLKERPNRVTTTDLAVIDALAAGDSEKADVIRVREVLVDQEDHDKAAALLAKYASTPEKREKFAARYAKESWGRQLAGEIDASFGKGSAKSNLLHNSAKGDKVGIKAARIELAFQDDSDDVLGHADAIMDRDYFRAKNHPDLHSADPTKRTAAEAQLEKARAHFEATKARYKEDYGWGMLSVSDVAEIGARGESAAKKRVLRQTVASGDAALADKLVAGTEGCGTEEAYLKKHQKAATKGETRKMHLALLNRGTSYEELMDSELGSDDKHVMDLHADGKPETAGDYKKRADKVLAYTGHEGILPYDKWPEAFKQQMQQLVLARESGARVEVDDKTNVALAVTKLRMALKDAEDHKVIKGDEKSRIALASQIVEMNGSIADAVRKDTAETASMWVKLIGAGIITGLTAGAGLGAFGVAMGTAAVEGLDIAVQGAILGQSYGEAELGAALAKAAVSSGAAWITNSAIFSKIKGHSVELLKQKITQEMQKGVIVEAAAWLGDPSKFEDVKGGLIGSTSNILARVVSSAVTFELSNGLEPTLPNEAARGLIADAVGATVFTAIQDAAMSAGAETLEEKEAARDAKRLTFGTKLALGAARAAGGSLKKTPTP